MEKKIKKQWERKVSERKLETVKKLVELIKNNNIVIIASIKNLPSKQFQNIRKKLKGKAEVIVVKKRIILKAIENVGKSLGELKDYIQEDSAILFSKLDAFELAGFLAENKNLIGARAGQVAEEDIIIEEGPTDLPPGPAISEFGNLGIKIAVEEGKIAVKEKKVIVKAGEEVSEAAASVLSKLDIKPFKIGLEPIAIYDGKAGKIYIDIKIDKEKTVEDIKIAAVKALGFAQKIIYYCKESIGFLLRKASLNAITLEKLQNQNTDDKIQENKVKEENKSRGG